MDILENIKVSRNIREMIYCKILGTGREENIIDRGIFTMFTSSNMIYNTDIHLRLPMPQER